MSESNFPWRTLLFASVAINLLGVGAIAGGLAAGVRLERAGVAAPVDSAGPALVPHVVIAAFPQTARAKVREQLVRSWPQLLEARQQSITARRSAYDAAASEPFDRERTRTAFARLRSADASALGIVHEDIIAALAAMSPQERRDALEAVRNATAGGEAAPERGVQSESGSGSDEAAPRRTLRERIRERIRERRGLAP